jgi:hypothetical protein
MNPHATTWAKVEKLLRAGRARLAVDPKTILQSDGQLRGTLEEFEEFLTHNELELAWDALADVAGKTSAPPDCWRELAEAAGLMQLPRKQAIAERHIPRSVPSD